MDNVEKIEALLFSAGKPLSVKELEDATSMDKKTIRSELKKLARQYKKRKTAIEVAKIGPNYVIQLKEEYINIASAVMKPNIPKDILKTAALIAYYQPIKQSKLQNMIGSKAYAHIKELKTQGLIITKPKKRTLEITTSSKFPEYFGIDAQTKDEIKKVMAERIGIAPEKNEGK